MEHEQYITVEGDCVFFRPKGAATARILLEWMNPLADSCQKNEHVRVIVNTADLTHETLTALDRYQLGAGVVSFWPSNIRLCVVSRPDQLDSRQFAQMVAANRGLCVGVFDNEMEALVWLGVAKITIPNDNTSNDIGMVVLTNVV